MSVDIRYSIRELIESGAPPVSAEEIRDRAAAALTSPRLARRRAAHRRRIATVAAGVAAIGCASALVATRLPGSAGRSGSVVLTAAMVRHLASASRSAMAFSGRAVIRYTDTQNGALQDSGTDDITFSGKSWNDALWQRLPASGGQPATTQFAINRIVDGRFYLYAKGQTDRLEWYRDTNPGGHPSFTIPDPRTLLNLLRPSARFEPAGFRMIGGMGLRGLRATDVSHLPLAMLPDLQPGEHITALEVWADGHGIVHQMTVTAEQIERVYPLQISKHLPAKLPKGFKIIAWKAGQSISFSRLGNVDAIIKSRRGDGYSISLVVGPARADRDTGRLERQVTALTVTFSGIGQPQTITVPAHAIPVYGHG